MHGASNSHPASQKMPRNRVVKISRSLAMLALLGVGTFFHDGNFAEVAMPNRPVEHLDRYKAVANFLDRPNPHTILTWKLQPILNQELLAHLQRSPLQIVQRMMCVPSVLRFEVDMHPFHVGSLGSGYSTRSTVFATYNGCRGLPSAVVPRQNSGLPMHSRTRAIRDCH